MVWAPETTSFTTAVLQPPQLGSLSVSNVTGYAAQLHGSVSDSGGEDPGISVFYGLSDGGTLPSSWDHEITLGPQAGAFSVLLNGLSPNTPWVAAVRAVHGGGTVWSSPALTFSTTNATTVRINEFMAANDNTVVPSAEPDRFDDWIELVNEGLTPFNLGGWFLTDDHSDLTQWAFPPNTWIAPGEFLVVFASDDDAPDSLGNLHTSFKLAADGEYLALVTPDGSVVSEFGRNGSDYPSQSDDQSYGLHPTHSTDATFAVPTPGAANDPNGLLTVADTRFSPNRGIYHSPTNVVITTDTPGASIYFTTDGSEPTRTSTLYDGPIPINTTTILRARAYKTAYQETNVDTHS